MATKDLKDKYGEGNTRTIINRAIRAEILGGEKLLELRTWLHPRPESKEKFHVAQVLDDILFDFENEIRRRYGMATLGSAIIAQSGEPCPFTGMWKMMYEGPNRYVQVTIGNPMPKHDGNHVAWQYHSEAPTE